MLPAPGQGALAVQCRLDDQETLDLLAALEDAPTRQAVTAERQFLLGLGGGCSVPVAAYAPAPSGSSITLSGLVITPSGEYAIRVSGDGRDAEQLGQALARQALAQGAGDILQRMVER